MLKKVLSEIALYHGEINMPIDWDIDREKLSQNIISSNLFEKDFQFSKAWDMVNTYVREYFNMKYDVSLRNKDTWGNIYSPNQISVPLLQIDPVNLKNSPDFVFLYGVKVEECMIKIYYDDNRRKGKSWNIQLKNNSFIMFPSSNLYYISNNQKNSINFIQTITYEFI